MPHEGAAKRQVASEVIVRTAGTSRRRPPIRLGAHGENRQVPQVRMVLDIIAGAERPLNPLEMAEP